MHILKLTIDPGYCITGIKIPTIPIAKMICHKNWQAQVQIEDETIRVRTMFQLEQKNKTN